MKATIKNLTNGPRELRGVDGPIIVGAFDSVTNDFDEIWLLSARQVRYFEITGKDSLDHDGNLRRGGSAEIAEIELPSEESAPRPRGRPRKDA